LGIDTVAIVACRRVYTEYLTQVIGGLLLTLPGEIDLTKG
jgi:hypothetical protein